jgi:hypothetical protein
MGLRTARSNTNIENEIPKTPLLTGKKFYLYGK